MPRELHRILGAALTALALSAAPAAAQQVDLAALQDEAVRYLQEYLRLDTQNPPGNEILGARFFAEIFEREGIPYEIAESAPGRGNVWARLKGGDQPALVLLHHMDVVPADPNYWTDTPLSGALKDGYVYGRGALDTKTGGILHLAAFLAMHRSGVPLKRDVVFMATADEEAGGAYGAGWLVENRPEIFRNVGFLLNEGGGGSQVGDKYSFGIEVTQKVPFWFHLKTVGEPGHGSRPRASSSVTELVDALARLRAHEFEARIVPAVDVHFKGMAPQSPEPWRTRFQDLAAAIREPGVLRELQDFEPGLHSLTRNTCSLTRLHGSDKINVVPPEAWAELDCRLLPDQDPEVFIGELKEVLGPEVELETLMGFPPAESPTDTELFEIVKDVTLEAFPGATFVPQVVGGFTDSHFFRDLGIVSYGYEATATPLADAKGVHGNDERVTEENVRRGVALTLEIVRRFAESRGISEEAAPDLPPWPPVATFSILGYDPETGEVGGAVQSRVFSVGNGVLSAKANVGVVATQAIVDVSYGPRGLELLEDGLTPEQVVERLHEEDPDPRPDDWSEAGRQFSVMDARGNVATFTGPKASEWAGHKMGQYVSAQGNILAGPEVVEAMVAAFESTEGHLSFRLLAALEAGQAAGGDRRGMQSAAMLIVKEDGGVWLNNDTVLRLQVDDSERPIAELRRLVEIAARQRERIRR